MKIRRGARRRQGITLFEVVVALMIFTLTLPALNALVVMGTQRAEETAYLSVATMICRSVLAEAMVGAGALETVDWTPSDLDPNYHWKMHASDMDVDNVKEVQVWVKYDVGSGPIVQVTLSQLIIEPDNRGSTQDRGLIDAALAASGVLPQTGSSSSSSAASTGAATSGTTGTTGSTGATSSGATAPAMGGSAPASAATSSPAAGSTTKGAAK